MKEERHSMCERTYGCVLKRERECVSGYDKERRARAWRGSSGVECVIYVYINIIY